MKNIFKILLTTVFITLIFPIASYAGYIKDTNQNEYGKCIDLQEAYKEVNNTSEAYTGESASIEASRKANILSALTSVFSLIVGDQFYCINDYEAYNKTDGFESTGLLGFLEKGTNDMLASFPTVNVKDHLAQTFIPGYESNNSTMAANPECTIEELKNTPLGECCNNKCWEVYPNGFGVDNCISSCETLSIINSGATMTTDSSDLKEEDLEGIVGLGKTNLGEDITLDERKSESNRGAEYLISLGIDKIWQKTRNIAYMAYVVVVIAIGFMIMFRNKIGGQTMVTVGNSIPQLVLGIFLVTFSFAIVGLMLDMGKVAIGVVSSFFDKDHYELQVTDYWGMADQATRSVNSKSIFGGDLSLNNEAEDATNALRQLASNLDGRWKILGISFGSIIATILTSNITLIGGLVSDVYGFFTGKAIGLAGEITKVIGSGSLSYQLGIWSDAGEDISFPIVGTVSVLVFRNLRIPVTIYFIRHLLVLLIVLYATLRVYATMLITYIKIFANVILAPIQILIGSFPGNSYAITNWFKSVISNVLVFVGVYLIINLAGYLGESLGSDNTTMNLDFFGTSGFVWPDWMISLRGVLVIGGYLFAANVPQIISGFMKSGPSKEMGMAFGSVRESFSRIPLIGGMFGR